MSTSLFAISRNALRQNGCGCLHPLSRTGIWGGSGLTCGAQGRGGGGTSMVWPEPASTHSPFTKHCWRNSAGSLSLILTSVSMDHETILGNSLSEIAWEKLGILKKNIPLVLNESNPEILTQVEKVAGPLAVKVRNMRDEFSGTDYLVTGITAAEEEHHYMYRDMYNETVIRGNFKNRTIT